MKEPIDTATDQACERLRAALTEARESLLEAWEKLVEQNEDEDKAPELRIGFSMVWDFENLGATYALSFSVRRKTEYACRIPDPNQPELPIEGN